MRLVFFWFWFWLLLYFGRERVKDYYPATRPLQSVSDRTHCPENLDKGRGVTYLKEKWLWMDLWVEWGRQRYIWEEFPPFQSWAFLEIKGTRLGWKIHLFHQIRSFSFQHFEFETNLKKRNTVSSVSSFQKCYSPSNQSRSVREDVDPVQQQESISM